MFGKKKYGWFSARAAEACGTFAYHNISGEVITVTVVGSNPFSPSSFWGDEVFIGEVFGYVASNLKLSFFDKNLIYKESKTISNYVIGSPNLNSSDHFDYDKFINCEIPKYIGVDPVRSEDLSSLDFSPYEQHQICGDFRLISNPNDGCGGVRKWVSLAAIRSEGVSGAFYDADMMFDPTE